MWCGLVRAHGASEVTTSKMSLAALCEACTYMADERQHKLTNLLLMEHMWEMYGEQ